MCENPAMTFPIKKRISTEMFIDRTAALYIEESQIKIMTNESDQPQWYLLIGVASITCAEIPS